MPLTDTTRTAPPATPVGGARAAQSPPRKGLAGLGAWAAGHLRVVLMLWLFVLAVFGAFAPKVESALSGAGWQDSGSNRCRRGT